MMCRPFNRGCEGGGGVRQGQDAAGPHLHRQPRVSDRADDHQGGTVTAQQPAACSGTRNILDCTLLWTWRARAHDVADALPTWSALWLQGLPKNPTKWTDMSREMEGVSEETTTGVKRLYEMQVRRLLL
jgi:S-adenosyl-L-homocysteine hydrolase